MRPAYAAVVAALATVVCLFANPARAHNIPADVTVRIFVKPEGQRLHYLVRIPMASVIDVDWPTSRADGTLDLSRIDAALRDAATMWMAEGTSVFEGNRALKAPLLTAVQLSLESDRSFETYEAARAHLGGPPLDISTRLIPNQGMLDAHLEYQIDSAQSAFSIRPKFDRAGLRVTTILQFLPLNEPARRFEYGEGDPGLLHLDPLWHQAAWQFAGQGFFRVLDAADVLVLLFCLVLPIRRGILSTMIAFAFGQLLMLFSLAYGLAPTSLWFQPLVTTITALSALGLALTNIAGARPQARTPIGYAAGMVCGFETALALRGTLQFAGTHPVVSSVAFGCGVVAAEICALLLMMRGAELLFQYVVEERMGTIVLSALSAHTAWHWTADRYRDLEMFSLQWPALDALFLAGLVRWTMVAVGAAAGYWLLSIFDTSIRLPFNSPVTVTLSPAKVGRSLKS